MSAPSPNLASKPLSSTPTGQLLGRFPYVKAGTGDRTLVILPGFGDAMFSGSYPPGANWLLWTYCRRFIDDYTVYVLSRPRSIPADATIGDMAEEYAEALAALPGPADVLGISMGGMIGIELAARHPDTVGRLVVVNSGSHVAEEARPAVQQLLALARNRDWAAIRAQMAETMFTDWRRAAYPPMVLSFGRLVLPKPADPSDVSVSLEAILAYDGTDSLPAVEAPTLVVGGSVDPYFPESVLEETATGIPTAELAVIPGGKHGAYHERKYTFDSRLRAFLSSSESSKSDAH